MRIGQNAQRSVVFFAVPGPQGDDYGGTGFLTAIKDGGRSFGYLLTCRHVADALKDYEGTGFVVRLNKKDGSSYPWPADKIDWKYPEDKTVDLAACPFSVDVSVYDHIFYEVETAAADRTITDYVLAGDIVSISGLFHPHKGTNRNVPVIHTGNVAAIADANEPVRIKDAKGNVTLSEVHLVGAQTLDGLSGAPVFLHEMVSLAMFAPIDDQGHYAKAVGAIKLLGVYSGSWDGEPGKLLSSDRELRRDRRVPVGIGTVVPVDFAVKFLKEHPDLKKRRAETNAALDAESAASQDSGFAAPKAKDANPEHREDFTSLLDAAARKQPQDE